MPFLMILVAPAALYVIYKIMFDEWPPRGGR